MYPRISQSLCLIGVLSGRTYLLCLDSKLYSYPMGEVLFSMCSWQSSAVLAKED